ncbi:hypothetical protein V8F33_004623 [Rhypophila sp. PSN 637]
MKFTTLAPALFAAATIAAPSSLSDRAASTCWVNDVFDTTSSSSPLVSDCQALSDDDTIFSSLPGGVWVPTVENNYTFAVANGTCGVKGVFNPNGGSLAARDMVVAPWLVANVLGYGIEVLAQDGRVGLNGSMACMIPGWKTQTGWVRFEVFNTGVGGNRTAGGV